MSTNQEQSDYEFHPYANLFPLMDDAALDDLAKDIEQNGQRQSITLYEGKILDGRNRYLACKRAGVIPAMLAVVDLEPDEVLDYVLSLNLHRRHLTSEQKRAVIAAVLKQKPEQSDRQVGAKVGANHVTVGKVRKELEGRGEIIHVETREDTKGRKQQATKPDKVNGSAARNGHAGGAVSDRGPEHQNGEIKVRGVGVTCANEAINQ
jgi:ParB-like chromosome segregation protein Spo0J